MPAPSTAAAPPGRRAVLRAGLAGAATAGVLATAGCGIRVGSPTRSKPADTPEPSADQQALDRAAVWADQLATQYAEGARLRPDLASTLRQLGADHTAHLQALGAVSGTTSTPSSTSAPTGTPPALTATALVSSLAQAERAAATAALADLGPVGPDAARLLASIAACRSAHLAVLATLPASPKRAATSTRSTATSTKQAG